MLLPYHVVTPILAEIDHKILKNM